MTFTTSDHKEFRQKPFGNRGAISLIVIGLLAALIVVIAIPFFKDEGSKTAASLSSMNAVY